MGTRFSTNSSLALPYTSVTLETMEEINNTAMNVSSSTNSLLSDLEMNEYNLIAEECNPNFLIDVEELLSHDIANEINETFSPKLSSDSSFQFQMPCFDNNPNSSTTEMENMNHSTQTSDESSRKRSRGNHGHDHIMAERKRREKLTQNFIALAALVPNLKKVDKYSVLVDAIKYLKELKKRLEELEEQNEKTKIESQVIVTKPGIYSDDNSSTCDESIHSVVGLPFQVEARVLGKYILIRIQCQEHKGLIVKIMVEIQRFQLFVVNGSVLPFGDSLIDVTIIAQMDEGYNMSIKELVKNLRMAVLKFMST